jgi:glycosyltransferase involved in cell wall biosynthesis/SAM-dependent methyltransferase
MRVLLFGTYDTSTHPRVSAIAEGLLARGAQVAECNAPLGLDTAARVDMLARPWRAPALAVRLARRWITLARTARRMPAPDLVVVGYLGHFDVHLARALFRRVPVVLDHLVGASDTGRDRRLDGGLRQVLLRMIDSAALRAADIIVVDTEEHLAALAPHHQARAVVVPVGAPQAWYDAARLPGDEDTPGTLRVVFYGLYTPLQGTPVIGSALARLAGAPIEITMIGSGQDEAEARAAAAANHAVRWLGWVPASDLPDVVAGHDVCLGIFGAGEKATRVVPNKVFQGAAAGCAIVTSDTPPQRRTLGEAAVLVPPGDPEALAAALLELAQDRAAVLRLRRAAHELARQQFDPGQIVGPLLEKAAIPGPRSLQDEGSDMTSAEAAARPAVNIEAIAPLTPNAWLRYDVIRRILPPGITDVLEVGCGQGGLGARLAQRYRYVGLEPDETSCAVARRRVSAVGSGEIRNIPVEALGDERFDLVCAFEVLEHIEDDATAVKEWAARLRPRGWLMLSVPAHQHRYAPADEMAGHFRRYEPDGIAALLAGCGFGEVQVRQYGFPLGFVLEAGRNMIGRRRMAKSGGATLAERTAGSGRLLQPSSGGPLATTVRWGVLPFRMLQRPFPHVGTGLVVLARLVDRD